MRAQGGRAALLLQLLLATMSGAFVPSFSPAALRQQVRIVGCKPLRLLAHSPLDH